MDPHKASFVGWVRCILFIDHFEPVNKLPVIPVHFGISVFFWGGGFFSFLLAIFCYVFHAPWYSPKVVRGTIVLWLNILVPVGVTQNSSCALVVVKQETIPEMDIRS